MMVGRTVSVAMLLLPPTKPIILPRHRGFCVGEKKKSTLSHVLKGEECVAVKSSFLVFEKNSSFFGTLYYLNQDNPVLSCTNSYATLHQEDPAYYEPVV